MPNPLLSIVEDASRAARVVADLLEEVIRARPDAVLALPTGRTPLPLYDDLTERYRRAKIDFDQVRTFNLDEWVGVDPRSPVSYARYMEEHLFSRVNLRPGNGQVPDGNAPDLVAACARYEWRIREAGGIDLAILGIGRNGHIGFNEPGTPFESRTHVATVTQQTREANRWSCPAGHVPSRAITVGIATILEAGEIVLLATGADKAEALRQALVGPVESSLPASALRLHPRARIVADREAAGTWPHPSPSEMARGKRARSARFTDPG